MGPHRNQVRFFVSYLPLSLNGDCKQEVTLGQCDRNGTAELIRNCRRAGDPVTAVHEVLFSGEQVARWLSRRYVTTATGKLVYTAPRGRIAPR